MEIAIQPIENQLVCLKCVPRSGQCVLLRFYSDLTNENLRIVPYCDIYL